MNLTRVCLCSATYEDARIPTHLLTCLLTYLFTELVNYVQTHPAAFGGEPRRHLVGESVHSYSVDIRQVADRALMIIIIISRL